MKPLRLFEPIPKRVHDRIVERAQRYNEFIEQQRRISQSTDYFVEPLRIKDIDFMSPLEHWKGLQELNPVLAYIVKRIYQPEPEENLVMMLNGEQGSGKSFSSMELGYLTDDEFDIDSICFSLKEFKECIEQGKKTIVLDDLESFANSRESMTKLNRWLSKYFDMIRFRRNFIIMTSPAFESVEKTLRERTHIQGITKGINSANRTTIVKFFFLQVSPITGKLYRHLPIFFDNKMNAFRRIQDIRIKEPPKDLIKAYKEKKEYMFNKLGNQLNRIEVEDKKTKIERPKYQKISDDYIAGMSIKELAAKYGFSENTTRKFLDYARDKGYLQRSFKKSEELNNSDA